MAAYVHKLGGQGRLLFGRTSPPPPMFGLTADTQDELHASLRGSAFAVTLVLQSGRSRSWLPGTTCSPKMSVIAR
jgi:hypothetical protein